MIQFTEHRSAAMEAGLVKHVTEQPQVRTRWARSVGLLLAGTLVGAGASVGAMANGLFPVGNEHGGGDSSASQPELIDAPPGVAPGSPVVAVLGEPESVAITGPETVEHSLAGRPTEATHAHVVVVPTGPGTLTFGMDPGGNNPSATWVASEITSESWSSYDFPLQGGTDMLYLDPTRFTGVVTIQYVTHIPTRYGVNSHGQTYGSFAVEGEDPDLGAVVATNGREGFVLTSAYKDAIGLTDLPSSPEEALREQEERSGTGISLPVYESDGRTQIGEFIIEY